MLRVLGIDPGLGTTGWGMIAVSGNHLSPLGSGVIMTDPSQSVPDRLRTLHEALAELLRTYAPAEAAVEEVFVNRNGAATLKLGYARGIALLAPALIGIPVAEY
ncbi:MAG: crossover junction endodeoxyribonuclease RuvC, partial [Acetobacteraceae bacterium]